jgi:sortase A
MISRLLLLIGIICLGLYGFFTVQAHFRQEALEEELAKAEVRETEVKIPEARPATRARRLKEGDLFGRLEIPRLNMSVMVMEGYKDHILRLGAGHMPGTPLAIAGHRDSFFRPLKDIKLNDKIRLTTPDGVTEYRVVSKKVVGPKDTHVLKRNSAQLMTLITCYPFHYIGPAPQRFIVEAAKN